MKGIKSKMPVVYDSRSNKSDIVFIVAEKFHYDLSTDKYHFEINDKIEVDVEELGIDNTTESIIRNTVKKKITINSKIFYMDKSEINTLFTNLNNPIEVNEDFTLDFKNLIINGLLYITVNDPIYLKTDGNLTVSSDWEIY